MTDWEQEVSLLKVEDLEALSASLTIILQWQPLEKHLGGCTDCLHIVAVLLTKEKQSREPPKPAGTLKVDQTVLEKLKAQANKVIR